jgi:hypothetical protein
MLVRFCLARGSGELYFVASRSSAVVRRLRSLRGVLAIKKRFLSPSG